MTGDPKKSFSVGFVVFVATIVVIIALFTVGGPGVLDRTAGYRIVVESANNVRKGSKVYLDGVVVGQVSGVDFEPLGQGGLSMRNVVIRISIAEQNTPRVREGSIAWLASEGLLGDQVVQLKSGDWEKPPLPRGSEIRFVPKSLVGDFIGEETRMNAEQILEDLVRLLEDVQEGKGTLGQFLTDEQLYAEATALVRETERTLRSAGDILEGMHSGETPIAALLLGPDDAHALSDAIQAAAAFAARLEKDDAMAEALGPSFVASLQSIASILDKVDRGEGTLGRLINDPTIADNLSNVFLGVREEPLVRNLIRNAEASGRQIFAEAAGREAREAAIRAAIAEQAREVESIPVPASTAGREEPPAPEDDTEGGR